jgi:UDP-N-acetylmuramoyl-tripeptide--D-alanyl-D-alanine ligase
MWRMSDRRASGETQRFRVHEPDGTAWECPLGLAGDFNAVNAMAAIAVARMLGVLPAEAAHALGMVRPSEMRMTRQQIGDVSIFNDAYNANPDAVLAALRAFAEVAADAKRRVTVLGDMLELGDQPAVERMHAEIGRAAVASGPDVVVFVGSGSAHGAVAAREAARQPGAGGQQSRAMEVVHVAQLDDAGVAVIAGLLRPGDAVLLKGSRGSRMERLVSALESRLALTVAAS